MRFHPLTSERWPDLERLFGERGAYAGCWCMWWRLTRAQFSRQAGDGNRLALKRVVDSGEVPGIIAYSGNEPVGWCSVAPREHFASLERSRTLKRVDDEPVWSVVCFFVAEEFRNKGLMVSLLRAAVDYAAHQGARVVEGYPFEAKGLLPSGTKAFMGIVPVFRHVGFVEVARRSAGQSIMRYFV